MKECPTILRHSTNPPAILTIQIRTLEGGWLPVKLLAVQGGWVVVDDGQGPLWVMMDEIYQGDWPAVAIFEGFRKRQN